MSDLFLDTEIQPVSYKYIARTCLQVGYSRDELHGILFQEVGPAFCRNLLQVAGEWAMFSEDFVARVMQDQLKQPKKFPWLHRKRLHHYTAGHWATIEALLDGPAAALGPSCSRCPAYWLGLAVSPGAAGHMQRWKAGPPSSTMLQA